MGQLLLSNLNTIKNYNSNYFIIDDKKFYFSYNRPLTNKSSKLFKHYVDNGKIKLNQGSILQKRFIKLMQKTSWRTIDRFMDCRDVAFYLRYGKCGLTSGVCIDYFNHLDKKILQKIPIGVTIAYWDVDLSTKVKGEVKDDSAKKYEKFGLYLTKYPPITNHQPIHYSIKWTCGGKDDLFLSKLGVDGRLSLKTHQEMMDYYKFKSFTICEIITNV